MDGVDVVCVMCVGCVWGGRVVLCMCLSHCTAFLGCAGMVVPPESP